jgi:hypothetical protein
VKERSWLSELDRISLKPTRQPGTNQSRDSTERDRAFDARAAAIEKLKRLRVEKDQEAKRYRASGSGTHTPASV